MRFFAVLALSLPVSLLSTTLVALWTPEEIVLGADSRVITDGGPLDACKIGQAGEVWVAVSGLVMESRSGYELGPIARLALKEFGSLQTKMMRFVDAVHAPLALAVTSVQKEAPDDYARLQEGRPVLQAIFAARENGKPVLATIGFMLAPTGELHPRASLIDGSDARGPRIIYAGQQDRIRQYLRSHPEWIKSDGRAVVRDLVQLEVDAGTPFVGGPVDLMQIDAAGPHWIQRKQTCVSE